MSSRWRRPASTAGAVAAALRVRRPIVGLVRANYPPWPGGNLAHHPCTDNTLIISDTHENCKGFCAVFQENFRLFSLSRPAKPALYQHLQSFVIYTPSSVSYFSVCLPLLPLSSALFAFCVQQRVDFPALSASFIHTYPCVSIFYVADLPFF